MVEDPRRVTLEDYSSSTVPQFFTSIAQPEVQAQSVEDTVMASTSNSRLCRSSHSKISQNSLELGPFSLYNLHACRASQERCQTPFTKADFRLK